MAADGYRIGLLFSQLSLTADVETSQANATQLAIEEVNAAGGINGVPLEPVTLEIGFKPDDYRRAAESLCDVERVRALFGTHMSSTRKAVLPVLESRRKPLFYPTLYEGFEFSPWCFYTGAAPNQNSLQLARHVLAHYGKRVLFVGGRYVYPYESNRIMRDLFEQAGGEVVAEFHLPFLASDDAFDQVMHRVRESAPDAIYSTMVGCDTPQLYRAYRKAGFDPARTPIVSLATNEADVAHLTPEQAEGHLCAAPWFDTLDTANSRQFVTRYRARFGEQAAITAGAEAAYFQLHLYANAVRHGPDDSLEALRQMLFSISFEAPQGKVAIDTETQHTWLWPRVARLNAQAHFEIIQQSTEAVRPDPWMVEHQLGCF
ncbi:transporter substrate-binding domain-containing protein [Vreelandella janggokensis]|uniref:transporter substrate-binding domain-containing protein n=1 Tax=Vreelandella janggokensis TaxID=370767 RepID=UPI002858BD6B|nr:transporter substrate-binding domain-containing protein [Halomonas janggokensis]MDR5886427.1 transporter substrate-binding domain-containing protein [Halomonas janggokensis]